MKKLVLMLLAIFSLSFMAEQKVEARRWRRGGWGWGPRFGFSVGGPGYYGYPYGGYYGGPYAYGGPGIGFGISI